MKKNIILSILFCLTIFTGAIASNGGSEPLTKVIRKSVNYPSFAKEDQLHGLVLVEFEVDENGVISVNRINSSDESLGSHVKQVLEGIELNDMNAVGTHFAKFHFKYVALK